MDKSKSHAFKPMHKYPGLRPYDAAIWDELLLSRPGIFKEVWYNVKLGDPTQKEEDRKEMKDTGMYDVSCWCVDVVGRDVDGYWAIEIKPDAKAGALGQALAYAQLIQKEHHFDAPVRPAVLTDTISPITQQAAGLLGVFLIMP